MKASKDNIFLCCYDCRHLKGFLSSSLQGNIQVVWPWWVKQTGRGREGLRGRGARAAERNSAALLSANSGARGQEVRRRGASSLLSAALTGGGRTQQQAS